MLIPKGALVVSCQARADNPLHGPVYMSAMAQAAEAGGAGHPRQRRGRWRRSGRDALPIIGIAKVWDDRFPVYITPGFEQAAVGGAGADIIGIDATPRPRNGEPVDRLIGRIRASSASLCRYRHAGGGAGGPGRRCDLCRDDACRLEETAARKTGGPDLEPLSLVARRRCPSPEGASTRRNRGGGFPSRRPCVVVGTAVTNPRVRSRRSLFRPYPSRRLGSLCNGNVRAPLAFSGVPIHNGFQTRWPC